MHHSANERGFGIASIIPNEIIAERFDFGKQILCHLKMPRMEYIRCNAIASPTVEHFPARYEPDADRRGIPPAHRAQGARPTRGGGVLSSTAANAAGAAIKEDPLRVGRGPGHSSSTASPCTEM